MEDLWSDLYPEKPPRGFSTKALASVVLPLVAALVTLVAWPLSLRGSGTGIVLPVGIADTVIGTWCVVAALSAWNNARDAGKVEFRKGWAISGALLGLGLVVVGLGSVAVAVVLNGLAGVT